MTVIYSSIHREYHPGYPDLFSHHQKGLCNNYLEGTREDGTPGEGIGKTHDERGGLGGNSIHSERGGITFFIPFQTGERVEEKRVIEVDLMKRVLCHARGNTTKDIRGEKK